MKLIALVAVLVAIGGVRTTIEPGQEIPEKCLSAADVAELKRIGAVEDADEVAANAKTTAREEKTALKDFAEARKVVLTSQAAVEAAAAAT